MGATETSKEAAATANSTASPDAASQSISTVVIDNSGKILDANGNMVGVVTRDDKDGQILEGNLITADGEIVNESGDVLGQAKLNATFAQQLKDAKTQKDDGSSPSEKDWNLVDKAYRIVSAYQTPTNHPQQGADGDSAEAGPDPVNGDEEDAKGAQTESQESKDTSLEKEDGNHADQPDHAELKAQTDQSALEDTTDTNSLGADQAAKDPQLSSDSPSQEETAGDESDAQDESASQKQQSPVPQPQQEQDDGKQDHTAEDATQESGDINNSDQVDDGAGGKAAAQPNMADDKKENAETEGELTPSPTPDGPATQDSETLEAEALDEKTDEDEEKTDENEEKPDENEDVKQEAVPNESQEEDQTEEEEVTDTFHPEDDEKVADAPDQATETREEVATEEPNEADDSGVAIESPNEPDDEKAVNEPDEPAEKLATEQPNEADDDDVAVEKPNKPDDEEAAEQPDEPADEVATEEPKEPAGEEMAIREADKPADAMTAEGKIEPAHGDAAIEDSNEPANDEKANGEESSAEDKPEEEKPADEKQPRAAEVSRSQDTATTDESKGNAAPEPEAPTKKDLNVSSANSFGRSGSAEKPADTSDDHRDKDDVSPNVQKHDGKLPGVPSAGTKVEDTPGKGTPSKQEGSNDGQAGMDVAPSSQTVESKKPSGRKTYGYKTDEQLADEISKTVGKSLDQMNPICEQITEKVNKAEKLPKSQRNEAQQKQLANEVQGLIEQGNQILNKTHKDIENLDPDGHIQEAAKSAGAKKDASAPEQFLAQQLQDLTGVVTSTVDNAKKKVDDMPVAKAQLAPLWLKLLEPLGAIIAAVGLLLTAVLGIVGSLLRGLGLGVIVDTILGALPSPITDIVGGLGLRSQINAILGKVKE